MGNTANDGMRSPEWYRPRIAYLSQFILPERFETFRQVLSMRTRWMTVCMENTFHPQNASAIIRNCEAFGIQDIHTVETLCPFSPNTHIVKGTDKWIDLHRHADTAGALAALRRAGYRLIAPPPPRRAPSPEAFDVSQSPFVLIFGTEHAGISDEVKAAADGFIRIPMCGFVESLNVSASAAILLSQLSSRLRAGNAPWRLSDDEQAALLFRWLMESIRDSQRILAHEFPESAGEPETVRHRDSVRTSSSPEPPGAVPGSPAFATYPPTGRPPHENTRRHLHTVPRLRRYPPRTTQRPTVFHKFTLR